MARSRTKTFDFYDNTVATIAGNFLRDERRNFVSEDEAIRWAVRRARAIVDETLRTEPRES